MNRRSGHNDYDGKIAGLYDLEETLGRGHFAVVKLARHVFTGEKVAVKVIDKSKLDDISRAHLFQEVRCMKLVQHPNVVRLYEVIDTQTKLYLILELGDGGDLYDYIMRHEGGLTEEVARTYFRQIVRAISYCHRLHVVHRDLKPENVVFFEKLGTVKLTDFGFSNRFCPGQKLETSCGSLAYSAPEILLGDSYDAPAVDIWSLGVILYMLVCGQAPFQEANDSETLTMIMDCKYSIPAHVSDECKKLIALMLVREPERRATLLQIASDPWLGIDIDFDTAEELPLVSRQHVSEEQHNSIVTKMVNGNIATKEEILEALERNEYNHITATYFLLAERKLRAHRQELVAQNRPELLNVEVCRQNDLTKSGQRADQSSLSSVTQSSLTVPRTIEGLPQNLRTRKCSIVQEEEGEDDVSSCSGHDEHASASQLSSLSRRGSRSEGKLSQILQERFSILSEEPAANPPVHKIQFRDLQSSMSPSHTFTVVRVQLDKLAKSPGSSENRSGKRRSTLCESESSELPKNSIEEPSLGHSNRLRLGAQRSPVPIRRNLESHSGIDSRRIDENNTRMMILSESSSPFFTHSSSDITRTVTMPIRSGNSILEEIHENRYVTEQKSRDEYIERQIRGRSKYEQGKTKFGKTRTTSCSSSDASDEDSDSQKKHAHKLGVSTVKPFPSRRDSHDDSSDSQDPGSNCEGSGGLGSGDNEQNSASTKSRNDREQSGTTSTTTTSGGKVQGCSEAQSMTSSRKHRTGCRRVGETRLRESQSLNRVTEIQEAQISSTPNMNKTDYQCIHHQKGVLSSSSSSTISRNLIEKRVPRIPFQALVQKTNGFGAKILQGWNLTRAQVYGKPMRRNKYKIKSVDERKQIPFDNRSVQASVKKKGCESQSIRLLTRYSATRKKKCLPVPSLYSKDKLHKARSHANISKDRVPPPSPKSMILCAVEGKWNVQTWPIQQHQDEHQLCGSNENMNQNLDFAQFVQNEGLGGSCARFSRICHIHLSDPS